MKCLKLDAVRDKEFLEGNNKDPVIRSVFRAGEKVVVCSKCFTVHLLSSWQENGNKCFGCDCDVELKDYNKLPLPPVKLKEKDEKKSNKIKDSAIDQNRRRQNKERQRKQREDEERKRKKAEEERKRKKAEEERKRKEAEEKNKKRFKNKRNVNITVCLISVVGLVYLTTVLANAFLPKFEIFSSFATHPIVLFVYFCLCGLELISVLCFFCFEGFIGSDLVLEGSLAGGLYLIGFELTALLDRIILYYCFHIEIGWGAFFLLGLVLAIFYSIAGIIIYSFCVMNEVEIHKSPQKESSLEIGICGVSVALLIYFSYILMTGYMSKYAIFTSLLKHPIFMTVLLCICGGGTFLGLLSRCYDEFEQFEMGSCFGGTSLLYGGVYLFCFELILLVGGGIGNFALRFEINWYALLLFGIITTVIFAVGDFLISDLCLITELKKIQLSNKEPVAEAISCIIAVGGITFICNLELPYFITKYENLSTLNNHPNIVLTFLCICSFIVVLALLLRCFDSFDWDDTGCVIVSLFIGAIYLIVFEVIALVETLIVKFALRIDIGWGSLFWLGGILTLVFIITDILISAFCVTTEIGQNE